MQCRNRVRAGSGARRAGLLLLVALGCTARVPALPPQADTELRIGAALELVVDPDAPHPEGVGGAVVLRCVAENSGPLTVVVRSAWGDVFVRRIDETGATLAEADDGDIDWNARLVTECDAGTPLRLLAAFKEPMRGSLTVEAQPGRLAPPTGHARDLELANFGRERSAVLLEQGRTDDALATLMIAGRFAYNSGNFVLARQLYDDALPLAEERADPAQHGAVLVYLGAIANKLGDQANARAYLEDGLFGASAAPVRLLGESSLADCLAALGHPAEAQAALARAIAIAKFLRDRPNEARLTGQLASLQCEIGDHAAARASHERALSLMEALDESSDVAKQAKSNALAAGLTLFGDYHAVRRELREAEQLYRRALALAPLPSADQAARTLGQLAAVQRDLGDFSGALDSLHQALDIARNLGNSHLEALVLASEGGVLQLLGDALEARERLTEALDCLGGQPDAATLTATLLQLAVVLQDLGEFDGMLVVSERLTAIAESAPGGTAESQALWGLQQLHYALGFPAAAVAAAERRLALTRASADRFAEVGALNDLADLHLRLGDVPEAARLTQSAVDLSRSLGEPDLTALTTLAQVNLQSGDVVSAASHLREATELLDRTGPRALSAEQTGFWHSREPIAGLGEIAQDVLAARLGSESMDEAARRGLVEEAFRSAGKAKGRGLLQGIAEHRSGARSAAAQALRLERDRILADHDARMRRIAQAVRDEEPAAALAALRADARQLRLRADELAAQLRASAPADAALDQPGESSSAQVQQALLSGSAVLIEFANGQQRLGAFVVDAGGVRFVDLAERADVDRLVAGFLAGIADPRALATPTAIAARGRELYTLLLEPLLPRDLPREARLIIVPTPALAALPFEALVVEAPAAPADFTDVSFLLDRCAVVYAPSTPVLQLLAEQEPRCEPGRVLVLADALYAGESGNAAGPPRVPSVANLPPLPGTRTEALTLARLLLERSAPSDAQRTAIARLAELAPRRTGTVDVPPFRLSLGADATPDALGGGLREYAVIHIAAHGIVDRLDPRLSGLVLSPGATGDEFLSTAEVLELDLDADLVVLSACETGRGQVRRGEGVQSLARAFLYAGARAVVASLWEVADHETGETMQALYLGYLLGGRAPAAALHQARLAVRRAPPAAGAIAADGRGELLHGTQPPAVRPRPDQLTGHPYFWAPFVFIGLPR